VTEQEFQTQMNRLAEAFGKQAYSTERVRLIWREVSALSAQWWAGVVDQLIGNCRQAPLLPEIREACSQERERLWLIERARERQEVEALYRSVYDPEDKRAIVQTILHRISGGGIDDAAWESFVRGLGQNDATTQCSRCADTGLIFLTDSEGYEFVHRCGRCSLGRVRSRAIPTAPV
jgi:hypothetical protein